MLLRLLLFSLMATGLAGFGTVAWISTRPPPPVSIVAGAVVPAPVNVYLLAAAHTLRPGVLLKPEDLTTATADQSAVPPGAQIDTPTARAGLLGAMLRRTVVAGEILLPMHVMRAGERGFLAAVLGPGMRATTVGVDAVTGTAGLIWPGDHVDLILTETLDDPAMPLGRRIAGETVLHNVRVIAIDQELMQGAVGATGPTNGSVQSRTVTLEVSPGNAERIAVATRLGHLSLSVISADMPDETTPATATPIQAAAHDAVTWGGDVSAALLSSRKADPGSSSMHVYEGGAEAKELHF
jgi:pilus assembly protein CpaB